MGLDRERQMDVKLAGNNELAGGVRADHAKRRRAITDRMHGVWPGAGVIERDVDRIDRCVRLVDKRVGTPAAVGDAARDEQQGNHDGGESNSPHDGTSSRDGRDCYRQRRARTELMRDARNAGSRPAPKATGISRTTDRLTTSGS
jgi:hypothetical protein